MNPKCYVKLMLCAFAGALMAGCTLPVPVTRIEFVPATRSVLVASPKNVEMESLEVMGEGTNFTLTVKGYRSKHDAEVVRAAAEAQARQSAEANRALRAVIDAAAGAK